MTKLNGGKRSLGVDVFKISPAKSFISDKMNELEMTAKVLTVILVW